MYPTDAERPLTPSGEAEARKVGRFLRGIRWEAPVIVSSPKVRAVQTGELIAAEMGIAWDRATADELAGGREPERIAVHIASYSARSLFAVMHQPDAGRLLAHLLDRRWHGEIPFATGSFAIVEIGPAVEREASRLVFFGDPAFL
jgi:phosphohistidine phosphatase